MPLATDSGYLPDWLKALLGQGDVAANAPTGLFQDTAASPSPAVGLLSSLPQFTGAQQNAPWMGGSPEPPPDVPPQFTGVRTDAPWMGQPMVANPYGNLVGPQGSPAGPQNFAPATTSASYSGNPYGTLAVPDRPDVPLPPRRPSDLRDFQANANAVAGAPTDLNAPPPGRPNSNVVGTEASGAPEVTRAGPGIGDYLGKASNLIGGIYGAGGPGDALIALGLSNRTGGASIQALNSMNANRASQANLALKQYDLATKQRRENTSYQYLINKGADPAVASAAIDNPELMKQLVTQNEGLDQWVRGGNDRYGNPIVFKKTDPTQSMVLGGGSKTDGTSGTASQDLKGEDYLATLPERDRTLVQMIHEGRAPYPNAMSNRSPEATRIRDMVTQAYPDVDSTTFKAREQTQKSFAGGGKDNEQIKFLQSSILHAGQLSDYAEQLNNGPRDWLNKAKQIAQGKVLGDTELQAKIARFNGLKTEFAKEIVRASRGTGGSAADIAQEMKELDSANSMTELRNAIQTKMQLLKSRVDSTQNDYHAGMRDPEKKLPDYPVILPEHQAVLEKVDRRSSLGQSPDTETAPPPPQTGAGTALTAATDPLAAARDAIARGAPKEAVLKRLRDNGINTRGL